MKLSIGLLTFELQYVFTKLLIAEYELGGGLVGWFLDVFLSSQIHR